MAPIYYPIKYPTGYAISYTLGDSDGAGSSGIETFYLLQETGDNILQENSDNLLIESAS